MVDRRNGEGSIDDLDAEARRRAEEAERRWSETETALRARWDQREAALRETPAGEAADEPIERVARTAFERAQEAQEAYQETIRQRLDRIDQLTAELRQSGAVEPRQRIRDRLQRWWRGIVRRKSEQ